jgi:hypothetical protein|tara:strand:- start:764 stop:940 length:177 start_codon:yes stop_codon:yes gene_type:complete
MSKTSSGAEFRVPLEIPPEGYSEAYFQRLITQINIAFGLIPSKNEVADEANNMNWFMS